MKSPKFLVKNVIRFLLLHRSGLGEHLRGTHGGLRIKCDECEKVFAYSSGIRMHKKSVHAGIRYLFDGCDFKARHPNSLKNHIYRKHLN